METIQVLKLDISNIKQAIRSYIKVSLTNRFFYNTPFCKKEASLSMGSERYLNVVITYLMYKTLGCNIGVGVNDPYVFFRYHKVPDDMARVCTKETVYLFNIFIGKLMTLLENTFKHRCWIESFILDGDEVIIRISKEPVEVKLVKSVRFSETVVSV